MKDPEESQGIGASLLPILEKLPVLSRYANTRGWYYVISWLHRFTGIWLFIALMVHIYSLSSWQTANVFNADMKIPARPIFLFLAWFSSFVVSFHALNGGRLILYELFGKRCDEALIRWTFGLSVMYAAIVGLLMIMKNQSVSALFFWLVTFCVGVVAAYVVESRIGNSRHSILLEAPEDQRGLPFHNRSGLFFLLVPESGSRRWGPDSHCVCAEHLHPGRHSHFGGLGALSCGVRSLFDRGRLCLFTDAADRSDGVHRCRHRGPAVLAFRFIFSV